jgi:hypothetical protein
MSRRVLIIQTLVSSKEGTLKFHLNVPGFSWRIINNIKIIFLYYIIFKYDIIYKSMELRGGPKGNSPLRVSLRNVYGELRRLLFQPLHFGVCRDWGDRGRR